MKRQQPSRARLRTSFRSWAAFAAILLIAQFFAVAAPLGAQNPPSSVPDSFAVLQRRLDSAADNQLALVKAAPLLTTSSIPRSVAVTQSRNAVSWHDPAEFRLTLTHEEIAQMIGASRETVTRLFSDFMKRQLLQMKGSTLIIKNSPALQRLVET